MMDAAPRISHPESPWKSFFRRHFEWCALAAGLLLMAAIDPYTAREGGFCLLEWAGMSWCPGEGLGRSVALLMRGDLAASLQMHFMGIPAVSIMGGRISYLVHLNIQHKPNNGDLLWRE
ncbi:MAG: DUF2752 domain-containing protein [Balneolaceae bacterium]|nr:DUF2752 domain-containing protein [Balneolaceae bacterium]